MCIGTCTMVIPFISIFVDNSYFKLMMSMIAVITLTGLIITYYQFSKYCGKDKAEGQ